MNLKDLNIEKVALALLIIFVLVLFVDYTFNISILISKFYQLDIDVEQRKKLLELVSISIVPILYFLSKASFHRKESNKLFKQICQEDDKDKIEVLKKLNLKIDSEPDIMIISLMPFLAFITGFYLKKIDFLSSVESLVLIMFIQLMLLLTVFTTLELFLSKVITGYANFNKKIFNKKKTQ